MSTDLPGAFVRSVAGPPDPFSVDLEALGVELPPEVTAAIAADPDLAAERKELAALTEWWVRAGPPLAAPRARRWPVLLGGVVLVGALAASVLLAIDPPEPGEDGVTMRARGSLDVAVVPLRGGVPLEAGAPLSPGDELEVRIVAAERGQVALATVEAAGEVSVLVAGAAVDAGAVYRPPGRVRLDRYAGQEWLVVWVGAAVPAGPAEIEAAARALLPDPVAAASSREDLMVYEITRGEAERR